jgi:hypothetical protein
VRTLLDQVDADAVNRRIQALSDADTAQPNDFLSPT